MLTAALGLLATTAVHLVLCPVLVFGVGPFAGWGVAGAATSTLVANGVAGLGMAAWLARPGGALPLFGNRWVPQWELVKRLMRVGLPAAMNPQDGPPCVAGCYGRSSREDDFRLRAFLAREPVYVPRRVVTPKRDPLSPIR